MVKQYVGAPQSEMVLKITWTITNKGWKSKTIKNNWEHLRKCLQHYVYKYTELEKTYLINVSPSLKRQHHEFFNLHFYVKNPFWMTVFWANILSKNILHSQRCSKLISNILKEVGCFGQFRHLWYRGKENHDK